MVIVERGNPQTLRHAFGPSLLDDGHDSRPVQECLGHRDVPTTIMISTRVLSRGHSGVRSLADRMFGV